jgi:hypothetical protein
MLLTRNQIKILFLNYRFQFRVIGNFQFIYILVFRVAWREFHTLFFENK